MIEPRPRRGAKGEATIEQNSCKNIADLLSNLPFASVGRACGCEIVVEGYPVDVGQGFRRTPTGNNKWRHNIEEGCDSEGEDDEVVRLPPYHQTDEARVGEGGGATKLLK